MKYDIAIIGGGPAGLSAAITASSKGRKVVVFEAHGFSPRLRSVELITDYMGCPDISGNELMDRFIEDVSKRQVYTLNDKAVAYGEKQRQQLLETIADASKRMERIIGNLLDTARLESGMLQLKLDWCDLEDVVSGALRRSKEHTPVSYTHLDVYKRQAFCSMCIFLQFFIIACMEMMN